MFVGLYWPDMVILLGIFILSYNFFQHKKYNLFTVIEWWKILGIMLVAAGIDAIIRKTFKK